MTFVDIAGLVRGASKGEGLGNQFLANIRECDAIAHVLRCFEDGDITHVEGRIDPVADAETVETELMLADLESLEKRVRPLEKKRQGRRQGSQGPGSPAAARRWRCCATASRRAPVEVAAEERKALAAAAAADRQAGALRLQRRGGRRRHRQRASRERSKTRGRGKARAPS